MNEIHAQDAVLHVKERGYKADFRCPINLLTRLTNSEQSLFTEASHVYTTHCGNVVLAVPVFDDKNILIAYDFFTNPFLD